MISHKKHRTWEGVSVESEIRIVQNRSVGVQKYHSYKLHISVCCTHVSKSNPSSTELEHNNREIQNQK